MPSPVSSLQLLALFMLGAALLGTVSNSIVRRLSNPVGKFRLLYGLVFLPVSLVAYAGLASLGFGESVVVALVASTAGFVSSVLGNVVDLLGGGLVWLAAYAPTVRGLSAVRGIELSTKRALGLMGRYVIGLSVILGLLLAPLRAAPTHSTPQIAGIGVVVLGGLFLFGSPWLLPLVRSTNPPTPMANDRLDRLNQQAGLSAHDVQVIDTDDEETATAFVRGPPGFRRLFVTSTFLDQFDDETATSLLAIRAGRQRSHVLLTRVGMVVVTGLLLVALVTDIGPWFPLSVAVIATLVVGSWLSRRGIRSADDYAIRRTGPEAVVDAIERYAEVHGIESSHRNLPNPFAVNIPLGDRLDRLRARTEK